MKILVSIIILVSVIIGGFLLLNQDKPLDNKIAVTATVYKSPSCGCCVGYSKALEKNDFEVDVVSTEDMQSVKDQHNIPRDMESCHTTIIDNYFIEGHVPLETVNKLLAEKPDIDGIALPNMPAGTPGMPGIKQGPYIIYQLVDGEYSEYVTI